MAALPWWRVMTGTSGHGKVSDLCELLEDEQADAFVFRLWDHCAEKLGSGRFEGINPARQVERAVRFCGVPGQLAEAMLKVGLLERDGESLVVHDWNEVQSALASKFEKDRARANARRRNPSANADELQSHGKSYDGLKTVLRPSDRPSNGASPSLLSVSSSKGVQGETAPGSLMDRLAAAFTAARGQAYQPTRGEEEALRTLLSLARGDEDEVVRRWSIGLGWRGYPGCSSLQELKQERCWGRFTAPQPEPQSFQKPAAKGFSTIEYRTGEGNDFS